MIYAPNSIDKATVFVFPDIATGDDAEARKSRAAAALSRHSESSCVLPLKSPTTHNPQPTTVYIDSMHFEGKNKPLLICSSPSPRCAKPTCREVARSSMCSGKVVFIFPHEVASSPGCALRKKASTLNQRCQGLFCRSVWVMCLLPLQCIMTK